MTLFRRHRPPFWQRQAVRLPLLGALALSPLLSLAQAPSDALAAADPDSPSTPLAAADTFGAQQPALASLPADLREAMQRWRSVNQRVAEFPRGHIDLLRWEARQKPDAAARPAARPSTPLNAEDAWLQALRLRPDLVEQPVANEPERRARAQALVDLRRSVNRAWTGAVATQANVRLQEARLESARLGAELGRRMVHAGNWSQARLLREQMLQADEEAAWLQARQAAVGALESLARLLGLWRPEDLQALPDRLPADLPAVPPAGVQPPSTEGDVLASDAALGRLRAEVQRETAAVPPEQRQRWREAFTQALSPASGTNTGEGPAIGDPRLLRDHPLQSAVEAEARLLQAATERRSWAREAWQRLQTTRALAEQAQNVRLPLRQAAEQETLLRYNGMLQSTWDLLAAARERLQAAQDALDARREHWLAQADWQALVAGAAYQPDAASGNSPATPTPSGDH